VSRVFRDLIPQRANGHSEHTRRRGTISAGAHKCLEHEITFDISDRQADQPSRQTAAGGVGYWRLRVQSHARYSTVRTILNPAPEDKNEVNEFLTRTLNLELDKRAAPYAGRIPEEKKPVDSPGSPGEKLQVRG